MYYCHLLTFYYFYIIIYIMHFLYSIIETVLYVFYDAILNKSVIVIVCLHCECWDSVSSFPNL